MTALPAAFICSMSILLKDELPAFLCALEAPYTRGIRMRSGGDPSVVPGSVLSPVPWQQDAYYLSVDSSAGAHPLHEAGAYYLQEPSAMTPAAALCVMPGERVLDLCAAPGGKSTQLAACMHGEGILVCNEPVPSRALVLSRNIERMGVTNAVVISEYPEKLAERWPGFFDKVLVDAPCSGEGMFRRHPEARAQWRESQAAGCAARQLAILRCAAKLLKPNGRLAYSTCTFNTDENEGVIQAFLREQNAFTRLPFALPGLPDAPEGMLRVWPHRATGEGHFTALLEKHDGHDARSRPVDLPQLSVDASMRCKAFLDELGISFPGELAYFSGRVVSPPRECPPLEGIRVLRVGLCIGELRNARFIPDHALALGGVPRKTLAVSQRDAERFLRGESLVMDGSLRGYVALTFAGYPLGFAKASDGMLKNHYPKGLRKQMQSTGE